MDSHFVEGLARRLADSVPGNLRSAGKDLEQNFRGLLQSSFERMELVSREEFEIQRKVLERTREKLEVLEARLAELEAADGAERPTADDPPPTG